MERHFRIFSPGGVVSDVFFDFVVRDPGETGDVPSPREQLTAALTGRTSQGRRIGSLESVGMDEFPALDTSGGRLLVALMVNEFRGYGFDDRTMTEEQIEQAEAELAELGRAIYERAVAASVPLSPDVLSRSVERILDDPVVQGFAPFVALLVGGVPQVEGPNQRVLTMANAMAVAGALGRYALGHVRLSPDSPAYRLAAEALEKVAVLLTTGTVPVEERARVEGAVRSAEMALTAVLESSAPAAIEWPAEIEALDGTLVPVDQVSQVQHRDASDVQVGVSLRGAGPWRGRQQSYGLLPEVEHYTEVRWAPPEGGWYRASAVVAEGPRKEAPFGKVFLVGVDGDGTVARLPVQGGSIVSFAYERVADYVFARVPALTAASWDTAVWWVGADVAGPYARGRDPLQWPVAGQVLSNRFDRWLWTSALGGEPGFATRREADGNGGQKQVTWLRLEEGDSLAGFRPEPSSVQLAVWAERVAGDRRRAGDVQRWWRAVRLVFGPLLEDDVAVFEALLRGFRALDEWRAGRGDASPLTWSGLLDVVNQYMDLVNAYVSESGRAPLVWWQVLPLALVSAAGEIGVELELSRLDLTPRYEPRRAWEEAPESPVAPRAGAADEPPGSPAPVRPASPRSIEPGPAGGLEQLPAARPLAVDTADSADSADQVFVPAWNAHAGAWTAFAEAATGAASAERAGRASGEDTLMADPDQEPDFWAGVERARERLEEAEARLWALGVPLDVLAGARGAATGEAAEAPVVPRDDAQRRWIAEELTEEDVNPVAARLAASATTGLDEADVRAAGVTPVYDQQAQIQMALRGDSGDNRVPVHALPPLELARVLMMRPGPWTDALDDVAANASRRLWASAYADFAGAAAGAAPGTALGGAMETDVARAWAAAVSLVLPVEPHAVLADSRYAGDGFRRVVRQVADHLLMWGPDTEAALRSAAELADILRLDLGLRRRWDVPAADGAGSGGSASRVFVAPVA
ncbi:hypothetical protein ACWDSL_52765, partial [Streptomyces sp. NPDC000941]